ncbi:MULTISPECIES: chorismate mutase [Aquitalea]|uniref:chorismate mutase n=2 Tax=Aquitalea TaxID=407217 RepID=A0A454JK88_9NEIS|nr:MULTISPECIES: chorismate mutase [Aquitalea]MBA4710837.1 chorismate mutase [Aquitalea magnusonii]RMC99671.1 chorismate mutase [Aquitalea palustris]
MEFVYQCQNLPEVRTQIDRIDRELVALLAERGLYVKQAAAFKQSSDEVEGGKRVDQVMRRVEKLAGELGADPQLTAEVYRTMISHFIASEMHEFERQQAAMGKTAPSA